MSAEYPKDEFDVAGEDMPVGMHRPLPSRWRSVWPFLAVLVIAPLLGWGVSTFFTSGIPDSSASGALPATSTEEQSSVEQPPAADTQGTQSAPAQDPANDSGAQSVQTDAPPSAPEPVKYGAIVSVLNGTGRSGWAATNADKLTSGGFTSVNAANAVDWASTVSVVYYRDASFETTAKQVAELLEISDVRQSSDVGEADIVALLK